MRLPIPRAVVCISAHWATLGVWVTAEAAASAPTIYESDGFPTALFNVQYPAPAAPKLVRRIAGLFEPGQTPVVLEPLRGLDRGAWSVLCVISPNADVPVVQLSLDTRATDAQHYEIAKRFGASARHMRQSFQAAPAASFSASELVLTTAGAPTKI